MKAHHSHGIFPGKLTIHPIVASLLIGIVLLAGCSGGEDRNGGTTGGAGITVNTAADITQVSADDYNNNVNGLITGTTLMSWLDNWTANRPGGITGRLIVLQTGSPSGAGYTAYEYVKHDDANTFTYDVGPGEWVMTRNNGVMTTISMVLDGPSMDAFLKKYGIDPTRDMIVFATGKGSTFGDMLIGRGWYLFRYWGVGKEHLAMLNGSTVKAIGKANTGYFTATASTPPENGNFSVRNIPVDNTSLQATLEEMLKIALGEYSPPGGAFIWDSRSPDEFNGVQNKTNGTTAGTKVAFEGHIRGAVNLNFTSLLVTDDDIGDGYGASYGFLPKAQLQSLVAGLGYVPGQTVYTHCRTTYRAMITGFTTAAILGYPTKFYDGAWIEWGSLANYQNLSGTFNLPGDSPWRTEFATDALTYNPSNVVEPAAVTNPYAPSANTIIAEDKAYKTGSTGTGGGGGGVPPNPCG